MNIPQLCFDHPQLHSNLSIPPLPSDEALGGAVGSLRILDTCQKKLAPKGVPKILNIQLQKGQLTSKYCIAYTLRG